MRKSIEERFWAKVDQSGGQKACWPWTAWRNKAGYGLFWDGGKMVKAHRYAYELAHGPIPGGLHGLHRCDNPPCCNPAHLFLGTQAANMADCNAKGRQARPRGELNGQAKLTEAQVVEIRAAYAAGGVTQAELGARFGVDQTTISCIVRGRHWRPKCVSPE